jgi:hypothetical protein
MIARAEFFTDFSFVCVAVNANQALREFQTNDCRVICYPPISTKQDKDRARAAGLAVNGKAADYASLIRIDFIKPSFNRSASMKPDEWDPPLNFILDVAANYMHRLRFVAQAPQLMPQKIANVPVLLTYLDDEEEPVGEQADARPFRAKDVRTLQWTTISDYLFSEVQALPPDFKTPTWISLLLDAAEMLPSIGAPIVLAHTALEVLSAVITDELATKSQLPPEIWSWMYNRGDPDKHPNTQDRLDTFLKVFTGHSLKEENVLWEQYTQLRSARNNFVHRGIATIGRSGAEIDAGKAAELVSAALAISLKIRGWLPEDMRWPIHTVREKMDVSFELGDFLNVAARRAALLEGT